MNGDEPDLRESLARLEKRIEKLHWLIGMQSWGIAAVGIVILLQMSSWLFWGAVIGLGILCSVHPSFAPWRRRIGSLLQWMARFLQGPPASSSRRDTI